MLPRPLAQLPASALARLGAVILAVAAVAPGQPLRAAPAVNGAPIANNDSLAAFTDQDVANAQDAGRAGHGEGRPEGHTGDHRTPYVRR